MFLRRRVEAVRLQTSAGVAVQLGMAAKEGLPVNLPRGCGAGYAGGDESVLLQSDGGFHRHGLRHQATGHEEEQDQGD